MVHAIYVLIFAIAVPLVHLALGATMDQAVGNPLSGQPSWSIGVGSVLAASGLVLILASIAWLGRIGRGLPISSSPPRRLVTAGPYHWSRHPIYLGAVLAFLGGSLLLGSFWNAVLAGPLLGFFYFTYACGVEEPILLSRFGEQYRTYQEKTALVVEFPLRRHSYKLITGALTLLSAAINRPKISRMGDHIFFWGYGIWTGVGATLGLTAMEYVLLVQGLPVPKAAWTVAAVATAGLLGSRMMWRTGVAVRNGVEFGHTAGTVGFVSWGVLAGLLIVLPLLALATGQSAYLLFDATLPALMIAHIFSRTGCAFYGCCYGKETTTRLRLCYQHPALKAVREKKVHPEALRPVQLISALYGGVIAALVFGLWCRLPLPVGLPAALTAAMYGLFRLGEEWLRSQSVLLWELVSPAQLAALALALLGLGHLASIPPGGGSATYAALGEVAFAPVLQQIHPLLLAASGLITAFVLSYHYRAIGRWK